MMKTWRTTSRAPSATGPCIVSSQTTPPPLSSLSIRALSSQPSRLWIPMPPRKWGSNFGMSGWQHCLLHSAPSKHPSVYPPTLRPSYFPVGQNKKSFYSSFFLCPWLTSPLWGQWSSEVSHWVTGRTQMDVDGWEGGDRRHGRIYTNTNTLCFLYITIYIPYRDAPKYFL